MTIESAAHTPGDLTCGRDLTLTGLLGAAVRAFAGVPGAELLHNPDLGPPLRQARRQAWFGRLRGQPALLDALLARDAAFDAIVAQKRPHAVLELGAGLAPRGLIATRDPALRYAELELPAAIARKRELLARTSEGQATMTRANFTLHAGNVRTADLARLVQRDQRTLVLAEGLLPLLDPPAQRDLWRRLASLGVTLAFDWTPAAQVPASWRRLDPSVATMDDPRDAAAVCGELRAAGFATAESVNERLGAGAATSSGSLWLFVARSRS